MVYKIGNESPEIEYPDDLKGKKIDSELEKSSKYFIAALKDEDPLETVLIAYDTSTFDLITMDRQTRFTDQGSRNNILKVSLNLYLASASNDIDSTTAMIQRNIP